MEGVLISPTRPAAKLARVGREIRERMREAGFG